MKDNVKDLTNDELCERLKDIVVDNRSYFLPELQQKEAYAILDEAIKRLKLKKSV